MTHANPIGDAVAAIEIMGEISVKSARDTLSGDSSPTIIFVVESLNWALGRVNRGISLSKALGTRSAREISRTVAGELLRSIVILDGEADLDSSGAGCFGAARLPSHADQHRPHALDPPGAAKEVGSVWSALETRLARHAVPKTASTPVIPSPPPSVGWQVLLGPLTLGTFERLDEAKAEAEIRHRLTFYGSDPTQISDPACNVSP